MLYNYAPFHYSNFMNLPKGYNRLATAEQVQDRIGSIASQIIDAFPDRTPLFVSLLRGSNPFTASLMHSIVRQSREYQPEVDYMMVSTYAQGRHAGEPRIVTDLAPTTVLKD